MDQNPTSRLSEYVHEPFLMMLAGFILYFLVVWKRGRNAKRWNGSNKTFWHDQKDEMAVALMVGMMFVIWDSQLLGALDFCLKYFGLRDEDADPIVMETFYYFLVAPAVEIISQLIDKFTKK